MARAMARAPKAAALAALLAVTGLTAGGPAHAATPMTDLRCTVRSSPANGRLNTSLRRCTKLKCKIVCAAKGVCEGIVRQRAHVPLQGQDPSALLGTNVIGIS
ncbi:hypothetical protein GCM10020000_75190 [Streptomyces olivoverticillatus]